MSETKIPEKAFKNHLCLNQIILLKTEIHACMLLYFFQDIQKLKAKRLKDIPTQLLHKGE